MLYTYNREQSERKNMLYVFNHGFYWYVVDKYKCAYFKSVSYKKCKDFINGAQTAKQLPTIIERLT